MIKIIYLEYVKCTRNNRCGVYQVDGILVLLVANVIAIMLVLDATVLHNSHNSLVALGKGDIEY